MVTDLFAERDDLVPAPVDCLPDVAFEIVSRHAWRLIRKRSGRKYSSGSQVPPTIHSVISLAAIGARRIAL